MKYSLFFLFSCLFLVSAPMAQAGDPVGKVVYAKGEVRVVHGSESTAEPLAFDASVYEMDQLETGGDGELKVLFNDNTLLNLAPQTKVLVSEHVYHPGRDRRSVMDILKGKVRAIVDRATSLKTDEVLFHSGTATVGVRGTDLGIVAGPFPKFLCFEGLFEVVLQEQPELRIFVGSGEFSQVTPTGLSDPQPISDELWDLFFGLLQSNTAQDILNQGGLNSNPSKGNDSVGDALLASPLTPSPDAPILPGGNSVTPTDAKPVLVSIPAGGPSSPAPTPVIPTPTPITPPVTPPSTPPVVPPTVTPTTGPVTVPVTFPKPN